jgi:4-hydroxymandelate oxidase
MTTDVLAAQPGRPSGDGVVARPPYLGRADLDQLFSVEEFEPLAAARMHPTTYDYIRGWAGTGWTARNNAAAFGRWVFRPRVLVDVTQLDTSTTVLGTPVASPILFAPTSVHKLAHPDGEVATARAAKALDTLQVLSNGASVSLEDVAAIGPKRWFQLYWYTDPGITREQFERAAAAGYSAMVLTVDAPVIGWREGERRTVHVKPEGAVAVNLPSDTTKLAFDTTVTWKSLDWLRSISPLPLVLKGIVRGDDARMAAEHGIDAVIVSNHGGRQLDGGIPTLDALPEVAAAAASAVGTGGAPMEVYMDGGVRRGTDVVKALALGARAVLVGRAVQWGLATGGEAGILRMLELINGEFRSAMALCGATRPSEITRAMVTRNPDPTAGRA